MTDSRKAAPPVAAARHDERLREGCERLGLALPSSGAARLLAYVDELVRWNEAYNLTAVRERGEMVVRHLLDSLAIMPFLPAGALVDVGSGAGLPGVPLALADPAKSVTVLEANGKKAAFLRHIRRTLEIDNLTVVQARAERHEPADRFCGVLSRALAALPDMLAVSAHLAAPGGRWLAMKGRFPAPEIDALPIAYRLLADHRLTVPFLSEERHLLVIGRADE